MSFVYPTHYVWPKKAGGFCYNYAVHWVIGELFWQKKPEQFSPIILPHRGMWIV
jgi:hypothetical protein